MAEHVEEPETAVATAEAHEEAASVQQEGVNVPLVGGIIAVIIVIVSLLVTIAVVITVRTSKEFRSESTAYSGYPDLHGVRVEGERLLGQYGVVDADAGVYRIPIDQAMDQVVNETYQAARPAYSAEFPYAPAAGSGTTDSMEQE